MTSEVNLFRFFNYIHENLNLHKYSQYWFVNIQIYTSVNSVLRDTETSKVREAIKKKKKIKNVLSVYESCLPSRKRARHVIYQEGWAIGCRVSQSTRSNSNQIPLIQVSSANIYAQLINRLEASRIAFAAIY